jgi:predicted O-linked N-acetylglucosamine transferase (SPINDLY family)
MNRHLLEAERLLRAGEFDAAAAECRKSLRLNKDAAAAIRMLADCHYNLGVLRSREGPAGTDAALAEFRRAFEIDPNHADAANNLGSALVAKGRREEGLEGFRAALRIAPREPRYLANLARTLVLVGRLDEASATLHTLARAHPSNAGAYLLADALLVPEITPDQASVATVRECVRAKLAALQGEDHPISDPLELAASYFPLSYHGICNIEIARAMAQAYLRWCPSLAWTAPHVAAWKAPEGRIRIGLASRFFRNHSISNTSRGLFEQLDRDRFEVIAIRLAASTGDEAARLIDAAADRVLTIPAREGYEKGDLEAARAAIAALELDVLFYQDVGLEPISYFLAFARLAPVQLTSFGHPDTTGIPNLDYFLSASLYELPGAQAHYSERLVELPDVGTLAYYHRPPAASAPKDGDGELGRGAGERIYLCPQTLQKVQPAMDDLFARIAALDPSARIVLIEFERHQRELLERRFARTPGLAGRVRFVPMVPYPRFLARIAHADVLLDTVHFNGQNTTLEAFEMGTPVVTLPGPLQRSRHGYGMYKAMGFMDLVAADADDYARKAVRVATDRAWREQCVARTRQTSGVLFENRAFIDGCEEALTEMVRERSCA